MAYIDKDLAIRTAIDMCVKVVGHGITQIDAVDIADAFENIPTSDVVEVKHGEWIPYECDEMYGYKETVWYKCSVCGEDALGRCCEDEYYSYPCRTGYCPYCGAKMDGGKNENV